MESVRRLRLFYYFDGFRPPKNVHEPPMMMHIWHDDGGNPLQCYLALPEIHIRYTDNSRLRCRCQQQIDIKSNTRLNQQRDQQPKQQQQLIELRHPVQCFFWTCLLQFFFWARLLQKISSVPLCFFWTRLLQFFLDTLASVFLLDMLASDNIVSTSILRVLGHQRWSWCMRHESRRWIDDDVLRRLLH